MTENESIKILKRDLAIQIENKALPDGIKAIETAIQALEEIQQYRAIGTVEEITKLINFLSCDDDTSIIEDLQMLTEYYAIGTIEEFKVLKEKNTPMELAEHNFQDEPHHYLCPSCRNVVSCNQNYCEECGQALET